MIILLWLCIPFRMEDRAEVAIEKILSILSEESPEIRDIVLSVVIKFYKNGFWPKKEKNEF